MVALVSGALWLLYPRQNLELRLQEAGHTELADVYLVNLLRTDPDNPRLQLLLAQNEIAHEHLAEAGAALAPILASPDAQVHREAEWVRGELLYRQYQGALAANAANTGVLRDALIAQLRLLAGQSWPADRRYRLLAMAGELDEPELVVTLSREGAPGNSRAAADYYERAARNALARGDYDSCAELYLAARESTPDGERARDYYNAAVQALRSAGRPGAALELAVRELGALADDRQTLTMIVELAREANRPELAEEYVRRLMRMTLLQQAGAVGLAWLGAGGVDPVAAAAAVARRVRTAGNAGPARLDQLPFDDETYGLAWQVFVENGKLEDAWAIANAAVRQQPADLKWRGRLAQVSEWTGRAAVALENWLHVAQATQGKEAWDAVMRLAPGLADDTAASQALDALLYADAGNPRLRLLLAQRQMARDDLEGARSTLRAGLDSGDPSLRQEAAWMMGELLYRELKAAPQSAARQPPLRAGLLARIRELRELDWPVERRWRMAGWAAAAGDFALAMELYRHGVPGDAQAAATFYDAAAAQALAQGDYQEASSLYLYARDQAGDLADIRRYYLAAVGALRSGDQPVAALELAERELGALADDGEALLFIVQLARSANKPAVADRYVRRLLRLSLLRQWSPVQQADAGSAATLRPAAWHATGQPVPGARAPDDGAGPLFRPAAPGLWKVAANARRDLVLAHPFDDQVYSLGYQVFVENGELEDAWLLARVAVGQRPDDMVWRKRLAQVSDWTGRPEIALRHWLVLARKTGDEEAWNAILELAPGNFDDGALAAALRHRLSRSPGDIELIRAYVAAQERLGQPQPAIAFLQRQRQSPQVLELLAQLAERAGQAELALRTWGALLLLPGQWTVERAMQAATLALRQGRPELGLRWLQAARATDPAASGDAAFLRLTGQVARERADTRLALAAYERLVGTGEAAAGDYDALINLLREQGKPEQAARVGLLAWEQLGEPRYLNDALSVYADRNLWTEFSAALARLDRSSATGRSALHPLLGSSTFLRLLGSYHLHQGRPEAARRYYEAALRLSPDSAEMQQALLWFLIDVNDTGVLGKLLAEHEAEWRGNPDLHDVLAAAYQNLSLPQIALDRYLSPRLAAHEQDFLWLMNYADALEENQNADRAWRLRRHLLSRQWQQARMADGRGLTRAQAWQKWLGPGGADEIRRIARARLVVAQRSGDPAYEVMRELLRQDRSTVAGDSNAVAEAAIAWLQDAGEYNAERGYLWERYVRGRARPSHRPLWAEISMALAEDDRAAAGALLEAHGPRLPRYDRVDAAALAGDTRLAQSEAFDAQLDQPDDDPLHERLANQLLDFSHYVGGARQYTTLDGVSESQTDAVFHWAINPRLGLDLRYRDARRHVNRPDVLRAAPSEKMAYARLRWTHRDGETRLTLGRRDAYARTTPWQLEHEQRIDNRIRVGAELGRDQVSDESLPLRLAGMKTRVSASVSYRATLRDRVTLSVAGERYRLQTGARVGSGRHVQLEYAHVFRQEAPVWEFSVFGSLHRFDRRDPAALGQQGLDLQARLLPAGAVMGRDYFLPDNFQFVGVRLSTNMLYEQDYTRRLRPFASVSGTWHSRDGLGYDLRLGLATNVFGADHLSLSWGIARSGAVVGGLVRDFQVSYRFHF